MKTFIILAVCLAYVAAEIDRTWLESCLQAHNDFRAQQGKPPLHINDSFCDFTEQRANDQVPSCSLSHDGLGNADLGENLAAGNLECPATVKQWTDEQAAYEDGRAPGFYMDTGHYTQVVWKSTTSLCCAVVEAPQCEYKYFTACNYYTPGNYDGEFEANV